MMKPAYLGELVIACLKVDLIFFFFFCFFLIRLQSVLILQLERKEITSGLKKVKGWGDNWGSTKQICHSMVDVIKIYVAFQLRPTGYQVYPDTVLRTSDS